MLHLTLREETKSNHAQLEKMLMNKISRIENVDDYVSLLKLIYGYYGAIEEQINQHLTHDKIPDYTQRRKAQSLKDDLALLFPGSLNNNVFCQELPQINSYHSALGALYVLEGSTLGGRIVARIISQKIKTEAGFKFFLSYGNEVREMWEQFKEYLNKPYNSSEQGEIIHAAQQTFVTFNSWLSAND